MTGLPAALQYEPVPGLSQPPAYLREANKRLRSGDVYEQEIWSRWTQDPGYRVQAPFYGFAHVRIANHHTDLVTGDYYVWLKQNCPEADTLRGHKNAQPDDRYIPRLSFAVS